MQLLHAHKLNSSGVHRGSLEPEVHLRQANAHGAAACSRGNFWQAGMHRQAAWLCRRVPNRACSTQLSTARLHGLEVRHGYHRHRGHAPSRTLRRGGQCCGCASPPLPLRLPPPSWQATHVAALPAERRLAGADQCCPCQCPRPSAAVRCPLPICLCQYQLQRAAAADPMLAWQRP